MRVGALSRELYIAGIPSEARIDDIKKFLEVYGPVSSIRLKPGFAFAHFEKNKDAADFMADFHGREVLGATLVVQYALPNTEKNQYQSSPSLYFTRSPDHRVIVTGLSKLVGWQDLKDFGRKAGRIAYADIDTQDSSKGIIEFTSKEDAAMAAKELNGKELRGSKVNVTCEAHDSISASLKQEPHTEKSNETTTHTILPSTSKPSSSDIISHSSRKGTPPASRSTRPPLPSQNDMFQSVVAIRDQDRDVKPLVHHKRTDREVAGFIKKPNYDSSRGVFYIHDRGSSKVREEVTKRRREKSPSTDRSKDASDSHRRSSGASSGTRSRESPVTNRTSSSAEGSSLRKRSREESEAKEKVKDKEERKKEKRVRFSLDSMDGRRKERSKSRELEEGEVAAEGRSERRRRNSVTESRAL